ncbi:MAG: hypothetical protein AB7G75_28370 [Candidatus Binatia bacterium]
MAVVLGPIGSMLAYGFPPYRSTDAETADAWTVEARLGLLRVEREGRHNAYASPLLRVNLGLPDNLELTSEFEYRADEREVADAAIGIKWVPILRALSFGVETLVLLPVSQKNDGAGVESVLLTTLRLGVLRMHINAGGFYDGRSQVSEYGWKSSGLMEMQLGRFRPGVEVFAKQVRAHPVQLLAGPGVIFDVGPFDLRVGLHVGLTREAADLTPSVWMASKFPVW